MKPTGYCQRLFYDIVHLPYFEYSITFFIILNTVVMSMKHYRQSYELFEFSEHSNTVFAIVFNIEMVMKLIALRKAYFHSSWNRFDLIIVILSDVGLLMKIVNHGDSFSSATTVIRGFRIMRIFKLIKSSVHIRLIIDTIFHILPQIGNVMSLILLLLFIYAVLGINLFSGVML